MRNVNNIYKSFILILYLSITPCINRSFKTIKKISDNGDYFMILESALYIYNFHNSKSKLIIELDKSIFEENDDYNYYLISNIYQNNPGEKKIGAIINHNLYVYTYDSLNSNIELINLERLIDNNHNIHPFNIQIDNNKISIYLIQYEEFNLGMMMVYNIKAFIFENYNSIAVNEPQIKCYSSGDIVNYPNCQFDYDNSLIKCFFIFLLIIHV